MLRHMYEKWDDPMVHAWSKQYDAPADTVDHDTEVDSIIMDTVHCCPLYQSRGLACRYCKQGINYLTGQPDTSSRTCPEHRVAGDGTEYVPPIDRAEGERRCVKKRYGG